MLFSIECVQQCSDSTSEYSSDLMSPPHDPTMDTIDGSIHSEARSKPGKTAKNYTRQFVVHEYHDRSQELINSDKDRRAQNALFPVKLHSVLDEVEAKCLDHIISWAPHGRCFMIHNAKAFVEQVMPMYFRQSKLASFQRQLHLYGFKRLTLGRDTGSYYHECFLRGMPSLAYPMQRVVVKGTQIKAASSPDQEPNFYKLPPLDSNGPRCEVPSTVTVLAESQSIDLPIVHLPQDLNRHMLCGGQREEEIPMPSPVFASVDHEVMGWYCNFGTDNVTKVNGVDDAFNDAELLLEFCSEWAPDSFYRDDDSDQCLKSIPYTEV